MKSTSPNARADVTLPHLGVEVRPLGKTDSLLVTASGRLFEIGISPDLLVRALAGQDASAGGQPWPELAQLLSTESAHRSVADAIPARSVTLVLFADASLLSAAQSLGRDGVVVRELSLDVDVAAEAVASSGGDVAAVLRDNLDVELFAAVDNRCAGASRRWVPFHLAQGRAWAGPAVEAGHTASWADYLGRRRCAAARREVGEALLGRSVSRPLPPPPPLDLAWSLTLFLAQLQDWADGAPSALVGNELEIDFRRPSVALHPVLPLPGSAPVEAPNHRFTGTDLLRSERVGVVTHLRTVKHHLSLPRQLATVQAEVADMARIYPWAPNTVCGGSVFGDHAAATAAAVGESAERYCGNVVRPQELRLASYVDLVRTGEHAVDPTTLVLYSQEQYRTPGFPFVPFTADLPVHWIAGRSLTRDCAVWVPASWVYVNWYVGPFADAPRTNFPIFAGLAAGEDLDSAVRSGLEEIIERDATMLWWSNRLPLPVLDAPPRLTSLFDGEPAAHGMRGWLVHLVNSFGVPVVAGVVENVRDERFAIGFGCRDDPAQAALKAWAEAFTLHEISRDLQDEDGRFWDAVRRGVKRQGSMKSWRADRAYLDDFRPDFRDVCDLECQMQLHLDPRARETVRPWTLAGKHRPLTSVPALPDRSLTTYRQRIETAGYEVLAVDITTPDVARAGLSVVRALVPGLVSNFPAAFPFNGRRRLQDGPVELGWRTQPLAESQLNPFPLAHA